MCQSALLLQSVKLKKKEEEMAKPQLKSLSPTTIELMTSEERKTCVLVVEDDHTMLMIIEAMLDELGYDVLTAENGRVACDLIEQKGDVIDVILLDRVMPVMDGMEVIKRLKDDQEYKHIPIIMQTGSNKTEQIREGIDAGVFYYLTKPFKDEVLHSVVEAAVREAHQQKTLKNEMRKHRTSFNLLKSASFKYRTLEEAENLSCFIANCFPEPDQVLAGLAELLINAIEHGNLQIGYELKTELVSDGRWREEIENRQKNPEYADKVAEVMLLRREDSVGVRITDQGVGFDWQDYIHIDPSRMADNHGRGIAQANLISFDELKFNTRGNQVTASVRLEDELEW